MIVEVSGLTLDADLGAVEFTRRRPTVADVENGEGETEISYEDTTLFGIVQPAQTTDALQLPEGVRIDDVNAFFCKDSITSGDGKATLPDLLVYNGNTYQALKVQDFSPHGLYRALAQRIAV